MLPATLPLFPLPNVVLFPHVGLPLHIFEQRYRDLVADALRGDRLIGICLLEPGWKTDYAGRPPVYRVGCAGVLTHYQPLPDGRSNIVLTGVERFRILEELHGHAYRVARLEAWADACPPEERAALSRLRPQIEARLGAVGANLMPLPPGVRDVDLVNTLSQYLDLQPIERQALLECPTALSRGRALADLLEMKRLGTSGAVH